MDSGKIVNPRALKPAAPTPAPAPAPAPAPTPILDRFRALLKQRDDELRVSADDDVPPPTTGEIVRLYELLLSELTFNSKPIITDLTIVAGEQRVHGEGIADAICARIIEVPVEQKLPSLYLLDSIVKNIGREYVRYFSARLPEVFCEAYRQVHPNMHASMRHLFGTWSTVFPPPVLHRIEKQLQFSPHVNNQSSGLRSSESPRPTHGIHVNPRYIRQLEGPNSIQHASGTSSSSKVNAQNPAAGYDEYDSDRVDAVSSRIGSQRVNLSGSVGRASYTVGASKPHLSPGTRITRPALSPSRFAADRPLSSEVEELATENSPGGFERVMPSPIADFGFRKAIERDDRMSEWQRKPYYDNKRGRFEAATYDLTNGYERERTRALINAYGNDQGQRSNESSQLEHSDANILGGKAAPMSWQNTEEEEFDWDKMNPSLPVHGRASDFLGSSIPPPGSFGSRPSLVLNGAPSGSNIRRSSISRIPTGDDTSIIARDAVSALDSRHRSMGKIPGFPENNIGSRCSEEVSKLPRPIYDSQLPITRGRDFQMPLSASGLPLAAASRISSGIDSSATGARLGAVPSSAADAWPSVNVHRSYPPPMNPIPPLPVHAKFDSSNAIGTALNRVGNSLMSLPGRQQLNTFESKELGAVRPSQSPNQPRLLNQPNRAQVTPLPSQVARDQSFPLPTVPLPSHISAQPSNQLYTQQGNTFAAGTTFPSGAPVAQGPLSTHNIPSSSFLVQGGSFPPLPPGPPPASSHIIPMSQNPTASSQPPGSAFSGLINTLMAQGLISLTNQIPVQDSIGLEFNADLLKVRHESAISALYSDLPRQCTTCGLRFKCREEHSSHMDWHVTKNRMSKNRKQKPSRKWFVSVSMWLSGAEALGADAVPGFLPTENIVEKEDDEELAVPADDEQKTCALCGEAFDDFYSDETEEWMYRGAVYLNAPNGVMEGVDKSQLGPIVHAKCRSESNVVPPEGLGQDEVGNDGQGSQRKRMRS